MTNNTFLPGSSKRLKEYYEVRAYFGTDIWIHAYYGPDVDIAKISRLCWQKAEDMQKYMNVYAEPVEGSLSQLNISGFEGVCVHPDVFNVLKHTVEYSRITEGAFDVSILPLVRLWKEAIKDGHLPDKLMVEKIRKLVNYRNIRFEGENKVYFTQNGMMADLGSPASGYFCDEVCRIMDNNGVKHFIVDGGGEIFCRGEEKGERPWRVGVEDPFNVNKPFATIELRNKGISTSGNYQKYKLIDGKKISHIIDPRTGYPEIKVISATVIAENATIANELSTALCVLGGEKGIDLIHGLSGVEALIIEDNNGKIINYHTDLLAIND